jgi:hypothetical protein
MSSVRLQDLPSDEVNKSRRTLLVASMIGFVISVTGAVSAKIEALGIEFTPVAQRFFFILIVLVMAYFLFKY